MKCDEVKRRLIESLYGELSGEEEASLEEHLAGCDSCRHELEALAEGRRLLQRLRDPDVRVDVRSLYRTAADRTERSRRRWRRLAAAASVAALLIGALAAAQLRFEWRPGQLTVSWDGGAPAARPVRPEPPKPSPPVPSGDQDRLLTQHGERIEALEEVARLLSDELARNDARHAVAMAELGRQLARWQEDVEQLARQFNLRWRRTERDIRDLYLVRFSPDSSAKGAIP
jgi:hypothetical protein